MGLYEIENIDNPNICTIAVNPKEHFEKIKNRSISKKCKGVRRYTNGMCFEAYAERITLLKVFNEKIMPKKMIQKRFQVKNTKMKMTTVNKVQFASLNDKRYYLSDRITLLPFGHPHLLEFRDKKNLFQEYKKWLKKKFTEARKWGCFSKDNIKVKSIELISTGKYISNSPWL